MSVLALASLGVWLLAGLAYRVIALQSLAKLCDSGDAPADAVPPAGALVALRPLHGAPPGFASCLASLLGAAEPAGVRVLLGAEQPEDPAVAAAEAVLARFPRVVSELRVAPGPPGSNRKVANLVQLARGLDADLLLLSDADVRLPPDYVTRVTRPFKEPEVGLVTGPYRSVPAGSLASRIDALVTNTHFLPSTCVAARFEGVHFGLGASIALRGEALAAAGGFEALLDCAADDYWLARRIEAAGFRLAWTPLVVDHVLQEEGWRGTLRRQLRWARVVRSSRPVGYFGQLAILGTLPALGLVAAGGLGWLAPLAWWGAQAALAWRHRRLLGLRAADLALLPAVDLLAVLCWAGGLVGSPEPPEHAGA